LSLRNRLHFAQISATLAQRAHLVDLAGKTQATVAKSGLHWPASQSSRDIVRLQCLHECCSDWATGLSF